MRISRLAELKPLAINITWGAGGSTKNQTVDLASLTQRDYGIDTVMHLTCTNMMQGSVDDALRVCNSLCVKLVRFAELHRPRKKSVFKISWLCGEVCLTQLARSHADIDCRADPPRGEEYWIPTDPQFTHAVDLVSYIRSTQEFSEAFCIGVAGHSNDYIDIFFSDLSQP